MFTSVALLVRAQGQLSLDHWFEPPQLQGGAFSTFFALSARCRGQGSECYFLGHLGILIFFVFESKQVMRV